MKSRYLGYIVVTLIVFYYCTVFFLFPIIELNVNFETIDIGVSCTHSERADYIIQTQQEWDELWQRTYWYPSETPDINFSSTIVIAVYMGQRNTGSYRIEITNIGENLMHRRVYIRETSPSSTGYTP